MIKIIFSVISLSVIVLLFVLVSRYNTVKIRETGGVIEVQQGNQWIIPEKEDWRLVPPEPQPGLKIEIKHARQIGNDRYLVQRKYKGELSWKIWSKEDYDYINQ